jgi:hypothetical protein
MVWLLFPLHKFRGYLQFIPVLRMGKVDSLVLPKKRPYTLKIVIERLLKPLYSLIGHVKYGVKPRLRLGNFKLLMCVLFLVLLFLNTLICLLPNQHHIEFSESSSNLAWK